MAPTEEVSSKDFKKLIVKRANCVRALKHHEKAVYALDENATQSMVLLRIAQIESSYEKFKEMNTKLEDHDEYDPDNLDIATEDIVEVYIQMMSKLKEIAKDSIEPSHVLNSTVAQKSVHEIKLPKIALPEFDGNYLDWTAFYDTFVSLVDSDPNISNVNKMHHLKRCLKGTALSLINRLPSSDANYKIAWTLLNERFNNKRVIVNSCLNAIMSQPIMKQANAESLRSALDIIKESIQCIESLDVLIETWDSILVFIVQTKMDQATKNAWESHLQGSCDIPAFTSLIRFLETRYSILESSQASNVDRTNNVSMHKIETRKTEYTKKRIPVAFARKIIGCFFAPRLIHGQS